MDSKSLRALKDKMLSESEKHKKLAEDFEAFAMQMSELIRQIEALGKDAVTLSNIYDRIFDSFFLAREDKNLWVDDFNKTHRRLNLDEFFR